MPLVDTKRLIGNYGVACVLARLSAHCLVRPVAADTDVGVDLYCETVAIDKPFLHFWLQVKTGKQCRVIHKAEKASCKFDRKHLEYWCRQPVPVFAALVPTNWPPEKEPDIYIVDITTFALTHPPTKWKRGRTLKSKYRLKANDREIVGRFLNEAVPAVTARLQISNGVVAKVPTYYPEYIQSVPNVPVLAYKEKILEQVRCTAAISILQLRKFKQLTEANKLFVATLAQVVEAFSSDPHWENPMALGLAYHLENRFDDAAKMYAKAKGCLQGDPSKNASFLQMIPEVEKAERHAKARKSLQKLDINI